MNVNPKTVRRVMVLIAGAVLIVAACAGVYVVRQRQIAAKYAGYREAGLSAFAAEDYAAALQHLRPYIRKVRGDRDALYAYATSRSRVEEPDARHLAESIKTFELLRELAPRDPRVHTALLDLYAKAYYHAEALELADEVLADDPDNVTALRTKALALERTRRYDEAVAVAEHLNEVDPGNLDGHEITYRLYARTNKPAAEVIARAEAMRLAHPQDPRFELLAAVAYGQSGDVKRARQMLREAARRTPTEAGFVRQLSMVLDRNRMFTESRDLLERAVAQKPDPRLRAILVQRLWQNGQAKQAAERLADVDPASATSDSELLALRALALFTLEQQDAARRIVDALAGREGDSVAQAWSTALATRFATPPPAPRSAIASYRMALAREPDNGIIRYMLGEAYERLGESEPALAAWRMAAALVPSWSEPSERMARALAATDRLDEALHHAQLALRSATPGDRSPAITYALVAYEHLGQSKDAERIGKLLEHVESIQRAAPLEPQTLPIHVALLARAGKRDAAVATARAALSAAEAPDAMTLVRLASVSRAEHLGLETEIDALIERSNTPITPELALARVEALAAAGRAEEGLKQLEQHARQHGSGEAAAMWQLVVARFREQIGDPDAAQAWIALGEAYPDTLAVQSAILRRASSAKSNRPFIDRTIQRVRELTGDEGILWKIERARWLLGSDREQDLSDAVGALAELVRVAPTLVEPRLLLAAALERIDNVSGAVRELRVAAEQQPGSIAIMTELARLLQEQGRFEEARVHLERAAEHDALDSSTRRQVAGMLAKQGELDRAVTLLQQGADQEALDAPALLLLAELHRRQGRPAEAEAVYNGLLKRTPPTLATIESAADFFAAQGRLEQARATLKHLESLDVRQGARELAMARFAERHETTEIAQARYAAATEAAPANPLAWRERIAFLMRSGHAGDAMAIADAAMKAVPGDPALQNLKAYAALNAAIASGRSDLQPLIDDLARDPANARALATAELLQEEAAGNLSRQEAATRFRQLAGRFPRYKPLQVEAVRRTLATGDVEQAGDMALRAMEAFPADADVARLATGALRHAGDWKRMEAAAQQWRARSLDAPAEADVAIAEARLNAGDPAGAIGQLAPHVAAASAAPERHGSLLITYARALAAAGRAADAANVLEPLLPASPQWRSAWMSIAEREIVTGPEALSWLERVSPRVMNDTDAQRLALARAYHAVGTRFAERRAHQRAVEILIPMGKQPNAGADVLILLASAQQAAGETVAAEANYRQALELRPDSAAALNNLAYLLLAHGRDAQVTEAAGLAEKAVALAPDTASFHDTLARARLKAGDHQDALRSFQRALELDPESLEAMIGKATVLSRQGDRAAVRALLEKIDAALTRQRQLPTELQRELELARSQANAALDPR